jgi:RNA polymerase sigma-70 factor (sigma-E family)
VVTFTLDARGPGTTPEDRAARRPEFSDYVATRGHALLRFAVLLTGNRHRAEDLVQDTLARAYLHWASIGRTNEPDVYVRRMLINASRSWWRRPSNRELPMEPVDDRPGAARFETQTADRDEMWRHILSLPHRQRAVLALRYYEDLDDATIAQILDCSAVTVRTHAMRALNTLRARYAPRITQLGEDHV